MAVELTKHITNLDSDSFIKWYSNELKFSSNESIISNKCFSNYTMTEFGVNNGSYRYMRPIVERHYKILKYLIRNGQYKSVEHEELLDIIMDEKDYFVQKIKCELLELLKEE